MSKAIRSYPKSEWMKVIERRLRQKKGGLGFLAALDAGKRIRRGLQAEKK